MYMHENTLMIIYEKIYIYIWFVNINAIPADKIIRSQGRLACVEVEIRALSLRFEIISD